MMKRILPVLTLSVFLPLQAHALVGFGVEAGFASWSQSTSGTLGAATLPSSSASPSMLWLEVEHPVPVLPNLRYATSSMAAGDATNGLNLSFTDTVLYYNLWDTLATVDVGIGTRAIAGTLTIGGSSSTIPLPIPVLYTNVAGKIPGLDLTVGYRYTGLSGGGQGVTSSEAYVNYQFAFGLGVSAGTRTDAVTFTTGGNGVDVSSNGIYIGVMYKLD